MSATYTIYHNPNCSKSRQTLTMLAQYDIHPTVINYLETPPDAARLAQLLALLSLAPGEFIRRKEAAYTDAQLDGDAQDDATLLAAMVVHPILIERPIVVRSDALGETAVLGRPPENVLSLIEAEPGA